MAELALTFRVAPPAEAGSPAGGDANVAAAQSDPDDEDTMGATGTTPSGTPGVHLASIGPHSASQPP